MRINVTAGASFGYGVPVDLSGFAAPTTSTTAEPGPYLCQLAQEHGLDRFPSMGAIIDEKIDGIRALWLGEGCPKSREGMDLECAWLRVRELEQLAARLGPGRWFIDAELVVAGDFNATLGAYRRKALREDAVLHVFDAIPLAQWEDGSEGLPLHERKRLLGEAFAMGPLPGLRLVRSTEVWMPVVAQNLASAIWKEGGEGIVVKDRHAPYSRTRGAAWQKLKRAQTYSVLITGWEPMKHAKGKEPADGLPRVGVLLGTHDGRKVRIAAGLSDDDRKRYARIGWSLAGRTAEVTAMEKTDKGNLRQARFTRWREEGEG